MKSDKNNSNSKCSDESKNTKNVLVIPLSSNETTADDKDLKNEKNSKLEKEATGGKRAWKSPGVEEGSLDSRAQSLEIFRKHKREELRQEIILVEKFMNKMMILQPTENIVKTENSEAKKVMENFIANKNSVTEKLVILKFDEKEKKNEAKLGMQSEKNVKKVIESNKEKENEKEKDTESSKKKKRKSGALETDKKIENIVSKITNNATESKLQYLLPSFCRIFSFPMLPQIHKNKAIIVNTDNSINTEKDLSLNDVVRTMDIANTVIVNELSQAVLTKFGLTVCLEKLDFSNLGINLPSQIISNDENVKKKIRIEEDSSIDSHSKNVLLEKETIGNLSDDADETVEQSSNNEVNNKEESKKPLTRKEKRNERNSSKKNKKKKSTAINSPLVKKIESEKELIFKSMVSQNILPNGFIDFDNVFDKKKFISKKEESQVSDREIKNENVNEKIEDDLVKKIDKIENPPVLKVEICSGAGEWAIAQVRTVRITNS